MQKSISSKDTYLKFSSKKIFKKNNKKKLFESGIYQWKNRENKFLFFNLIVRIDLIKNTADWKRLLLKQEKEFFFIKTS